MFGFGDDLGRLPAKGGIWIDAGITTRSNQLEKLSASRLLGESLRLLVDMGDVDRLAGIQLLLADLLPHFARGQNGVERRRQLFEDSGFLGDFLLQLNLLPLRHDRFGGSELGAFTKDMRMTTNHLFVHLAGNVVKIKLTSLGGQLRVHGDMEKEVTQFFAQIGVVVQIDRLQELGNLFDQAVADGAMRLLTVPRATVGSAESGGGRKKEIDAGHGPMQKAGRKGVKTIARRPESACFRASGQAD